MRLFLHFNQGEDAAFLSACLGQESFSSIVKVVLQATPKQIVLWAKPLTAGDQAKSY